MFEPIDEGVMEAMLEGIMEATPEGKPEGCIEGMPDGVPEGMLEGAFDASIEGTPDPELEAMLEALGALVAMVDMELAGVLEVTTGATLLAAGVVAVWLTAEGVSSVVDSLLLQAPRDAVNPRTTIDAKRMGGSLAHASVPAHRRPGLRIKRHKRRIRVEKRPQNAVSGLLLWPVYTPGMAL